jgi:hypothetical protein
MKRRRRRSSKFQNNNSSNSSNTTQIFARVLKEREFGSGTKYPPAKKLRTQVDSEKLPYLRRSWFLHFPVFPAAGALSLSLSRSLSLYICGSQNA